MKQDYQLEANIERWAATLRRHQLVDLAMPVLEVLKVWGFVVAQGVWMLAPFLGARAPASLAEMLERPEKIEQLQRYLIEGDVS